METVEHSFHFALATPLDFHKNCAVISVLAKTHFFAQFIWYCVFDVVAVDIKEEGEIKQPCRIPAGHGLIFDKVLGSFTCWVRELRKLWIWIQSHRFLLMFLTLSFDSKTESSTNQRPCGSRETVHGCRFYLSGYCQCH